MSGLNEGAYRELGDKVIEAKGSKAMTRGTWLQVGADTARLGPQIAGHTRKAAEASAFIAALGKQVHQRRRF